MGANMRHGPHHAAQKSTRTMSFPVMVLSNSAAVRSMVATLLLLRTWSVLDLRIPPGVSTVENDNTPYGIPEVSHRGTAGTARRSNGCAHQSDRHRSRAHRARDRDAVP